MSGWYYKRGDGETVGVLSDDELISCAGRGAIKPEMLVSHEVKTNGEWVKAGRLPGLRKKFKERETEATAESAPDAVALRAYEPPKPTLQQRTQAVSQSAGQLAAGLKRLAGGIKKRLASSSQLHRCEKCHREFARYEKSGQCPLCGEWKLLRCTTCGFASGARSFLEARERCPRCDAKVEMPGNLAASWKTILLAATMAAILLVTFLFVVTG